MAKTYDSNVEPILRELHELLYKMDRELFENNISSLAEANEFTHDCLTIRSLLTELQHLKSGTRGQSIDIASLIRRCEEIEGTAKEARNDLDRSRRDRVF